MAGVRRRKPKIGDVYESIPDDLDPSVRRIRITKFLPDEAVGEPTGVEARVLTSVRDDRHVMMSFRDLADMYRLEAKTK